MHPGWDKILEAEHFLTLGVGMPAQSQVVQPVPALKNGRNLDLDRLHCSVMQKVPSPPSSTPRPALTGTMDAVAAQPTLPLADPGIGHFIHLTKGSIAVLPWERPAS